jgi:type II secretory pathway pseudopilin PulG
MRQRGFQLIQLVTVLAILAGSLAVLVPPFLRWSSALRLRLAAAELVSTLRLARMQALTTTGKVGIKFRSREDGRVTFTLHRDGDGDGVRTRDIADGTDPQVGPERQLQHVGAHVRFGFPPGIVPRDPGDPRRRLDRLDDPIRFNRSDIATFNAMGQATPGSLYFTDSRRGLAVIRLLSTTGRARVLVYDAAAEVWTPN